MTNAEAWFNIALRPRKPEGSLGRTDQDGHLDSHTAPELCHASFNHCRINSNAVGPRKLSANAQFFVGAQTVVRLLQTTQII